MWLCVLPMFATRVPSQSFDWGNARDGSDARVVMQGEAASLQLAARRRSTFGESSAAERCVAVPYLGVRPLLVCDRIMSCMTYCVVCAHAVSAVPCVCVLWRRAPVT